MIEAAEDRTLGEITSFIIKPPLVVALASCMWTEGKSFDAIMQWRNFSVPMFLTAIAMVYGLPVLYRLMVQSAENIIEKTKQSVPVPNERMEGVATDALIEHLFATKGFRRAEVEAKFKMPRHRVSLLADRLEDVGILTRGENNARVLGAVSREHVRELLAGKTVAEELEQSINIVRPTPPPHSPAPIFTKRPISEMVHANLVQTA
jgi:hypothetical protein